MPGTTDFPTALDTFLTIDPNTQEDAPGLEHDVRHNIEASAIAALQIKVGIDGSADPDSIDARIAAVEAGKLDASRLGVPLGAASLDASGVVPAAQLPSYVDDVLEYANYAALPSTGETGKIYIAVAAGPDPANSQYRWSGSAYVLLVTSPGSSDAVPEGSVNKYFTDERAQDALAAAIAAGTHSNITVTYDDANNKLNFAAVGVGYLATSTTSLVTAGSGAKAFTTQAGLAYVAGARVRATSAGTGDWMEGVVSAYSGTALTVTMDLNFGTGTHADWNIALAGQRGAMGPSTRFVIPLCDSSQSTKFDGATKLALGRKYFDPNASGWNLSGTSIATLYMLLETTNILLTAAGDLYRQSGAGAPVTVAAITPTSGTTATLVSADVSSAFRPGANAGIFVARAWISTSDGTNQVTCSGAWIEVQP